MNADRDASELGGLAAADGPDALDGVDRVDRPDRLGRIGFEPDDLDGRTMEELSAYVDAGRIPFDPAIEGSPGCRLAIEALERLRALAPELLAADVAAEPAADESWVARVLGGIAVDARAGRRIPFASDGDDDLAITEGAVRGVVRGVERELPGVVLGRCRLDGDVTRLGEPVRVEVEVVLPLGEPIPLLADRLRRAIARRLAEHTELLVRAVDVVVHDVREADRADGAHDAEDADEGSGA